jgi:tetratricopeptide (TPR) repeat protein
MLAMALAFEKLEHYQSALIWLNRAIGVKYTFSRARLVAARILKKIGEHELAREVILEIPIANPRYSIGKVHVAIFLYENNNISLALDYFRSGYSDLKPHEKAQLDQNPIVKKLVEEQKKSILLNILQ